MHSFTVTGKVLGKPRPRVNRNGHVFTHERFTNAEREIANAYRRSGGTCHEGAVSLLVEVQRPVPRSKPKRVTMEPDTFKPDSDNIGKLVADALNGVAWRDDAQVVDFHIVKHPRKRDAIEHMRITVSEVNDG